jgi:hypothetical protein
MLWADSKYVNDFDGDITLQFLSDYYATDLSFLIFNTPYAATAYDIFDNTLVTLTGSRFTDTFDFSGFEVNRVVISGEFYAIDNVSFGQLYQKASSVPEPSAIVLMALGLFGLSRRKIQKNSLTA